MEFIRLNYRYRDYANYKQFGHVIFSNPNRLNLEDVECILLHHLMNETWFLHYQWDVPDLHFEKTDWENDHRYHEYESLEYVETTTERPISTIEEFLNRVRKSNYAG